MKQKPLEKVHGSETSYWEDKSGNNNHLKLREVYCLICDEVLEGEQWVSPDVDGLICSTCVKKYEHRFEETAYQNIEYTIKEIRKERENGG